MFKGLALWHSIVPFVLFFWARTGFALSISIPSTVTISVNTTVTWQRNRDDPENFGLYVGSVFMSNVPTSGPSGGGWFIFPNSWAPGPYRMDAIFFSLDNPSASAQIQLVEPPSPPPVTSTVTSTNTVTTTFTNSSTFTMTSVTSVDDNTKTDANTDTNTNTTTSTSKSPASQLAATSSIQQTSASANASSNSTATSNITTSAVTVGQTSLVPTPSNTPNSGGISVRQSSSKLPVILGAVLGSFAFLVLVIAIIFFCIRRRPRTTIQPFMIQETLSPGSTVSTPLGTRSPVLSAGGEADLSWMREGHNSAVPLILAEAPIPQNTLPEHEKSPVSQHLPSPVDEVGALTTLPLQQDPIAEISRLRRELEELKASRSTGRSERSEAPPAYHGRSVDIA